MSPAAKTTVSTPSDIPKDVLPGVPQGIHPRILSSIIEEIQLIKEGYEIMDSEMVDVDQNENPVFEYYLRNGKSTEFPEKECMKEVLEYMNTIFKNGYVEGGEKYYIAPINLSDFKKYRKYDDFDLVFISQREHEIYMTQIEKYESVFEKILAMIRNKSQNTKNRKLSYDLFVCANDLEKMFRIYQIWNRESYKVFMQNIFKWDRKQVLKYAETLSNEEKLILFYE